MCSWLFSLQPRNVQIHLQCLVLKYCWFAVVTTGPFQSNCSYGFVYFILLCQLHLRSQNVIFIFWVVFYVTEEQYMASTWEFKFVQVQMTNILIFFQKFVILPCLHWATFLCLLSLCNLVLPAFLSTFVSLVFPLNTSQGMDARGQLQPVVPLSSVAMLSNNSFFPPSISRCHNFVFCLIL